jgi:hypothetical protein
VSGCYIRAVAKGKDACGKDFECIIEIPTTDPEDPLTYSIMAREGSNFLDEKAKADAGIRAEKILTEQLKLHNDNYEEALKASFQILDQLQPLTP